MEAQHAEEHARFEAGAFRETLQEWLHSSWQGDALLVTTLSKSGSCCTISACALRTKLLQAAACLSLCSSAAAGQVV